MNDLAKLIARCKCGVYLTVNGHRDNYQTAQQWLDERRERNASWEEPPKDVLQQMIATDTVVELQFYPNTPIGFYNILHHDVGAALTKALETLDSRGAGDAR